MTRAGCLLVASLLLGGPAAAIEIESAYTDVDVEKDCTAHAVPGQDDPGDWASYVCPGWKGYPVLISYGDLRESIFYGFPPQLEDGLPWESFSSFNNTGPKIEWRILTDGDRKVPLATIHRWFVAREDPEEQIEVLVVEKVGQPEERDGCVIGYVVATGNEGANEKARRIADGQVFDFACGADQPVIDAGDIPLPLTTGSEGGG